ncbi:MAG TPA: hypothetical protein VJP87_03740 [Candidatus Acidoferrales bacterium]|nr:hypothetical protein [Candidatus Acidoferrales bacterium]
MTLHAFASRVRTGVLAGISALLLLLYAAPAAVAQGPAPETAPTLFPGGALVSYDSVFATRAPMPGIAPGLIPANAFPTFSHEGDFNFTWGFRTNFDVTLIVPVITNHFNSAGAPAVAGTGLGDTTVLLKYRFYRRDSARGTTQASITAGPRFPTGQTGLRDASGNLVPAGLQPGSGSFDFFVAGNWTYTGLFGYRRLVADEDFQALLPTQGTQATRLGDNLRSRFWLSYRPYESKDVRREWFIGPDVTWSYMGQNRIAGTDQSGTGGHALTAGVTSFVGLRPGLHVWIGVDWDLAHSSGPQFMPLRRQVNFGITQQFRFHL